MAIFQYTPSPFCILDEVDAPLDEPNIECLTRLLRELPEETQSIVSGVPSELWKPPTRCMDACMFAVFRIG